jgi:dihydrofolate synthase / folylpolyglutamate synthase
VSYPDSVRYLYSLGNELRVGAKLGLERIEKLLPALGNPERGQRFVHVAGTNGKGSTCAMIANALRHDRYRVGLYTSPHLIEPTERIQINGRAVDEGEFVQAFEKVHAAAELLLRNDQLDALPSYFETLTAMALTIFRERCDISVMEVGLGGRLDATNVIWPDLCVITQVSFDHESYLGNTLKAIASEKAGIMKPGVPVVLSKQYTETETVVLERAHELNCEILRTSDLNVSSTEVNEDGSAFVVDAIPYKCGLRGGHQIENALSSITACRKLGVELSAIQAGLADVNWPGRLELISRQPDFILDGAHNPAGAAALAAYIREFCADRPVWLVYGAMRDKAIEEVTNQLFPLADRLVLTRANVSRALRPETILSLSNHRDAIITQTIAEAIQVGRTAPRQAAVFFAGSLFVVGEARALLMSDKACSHRMSAR